MIKKSTSPRKGKFAMVDIADIELDPNNPRHLGFDLPVNQALQSSIKKSGVVVPVALKPPKKGKHRVVYGNRRVEACRRLRIKQIPAFIYDVSISAKDIALDQVLENDERADLDPMERAESYLQLVKACGTQAKAAKARGMDRRVFNDRLKLVEIKPAVKKLIADHQIAMRKEGKSTLSPSHLLEIAKADKAKDQQTLLKKAKGGMPSKQMRDELASLEGKAPKKPPEADTGQQPESSKKKSQAKTAPGEKPKAHRISLGDFDPMMKGQVSLPDAFTIRKCGRVAHGIKQAINKAKPFGANKVTRRFDWDGDGNMRGEILFEYENGQFFVTLNATKAEVVGMAVVIAACLFWEVSRRFVEKAHRAA